MDLPTYVVGAGGHATVVIGLLRTLGHDITGVLDDDPASHGAEVSGISVLGSSTVLGDAPARAVFAIGNNGVRKRIAAAYPDVEWLTLIHPAAIVHETVTVGTGTVVVAAAILQPHASVGRHCIINTASIVDHETVVGDFVHVATGARLAGRVTLEDEVFCGAGSVVIPERRVGEGSIVGAGAVVVRDIPPHVTAVGVPARVIKHHTED